MVDPMIEIAERAIAAAEGRAPAVPPDAFAAHDAAQRAELVADAKALGVTPEQLQGSRDHDMPIEEYVAFGREGGVSLTDVDGIEAAAAAEREARKQAEHERLVARVREKLGSA